jgi:hypothetical protein
VTYEARRLVLEQEQELGPEDMVLELAKQRLGTRITTENLSIRKSIYEVL